MRILITGARGFIGSAIVNYLFRFVDGVEIYTIDNDSRPIETRLVFSGEAPSDVHSRIDIRDRDSVFKVVRDCEPDVVIHCAAVAGVENNCEVGPIVTMEHNYGGTKNVADACFVYEVKKLIVMSTSEVYGPTAYMCNEDTPASLGVPGEARWAYAASKIAAEHYCYGTSLQARKMDVIIVRPFNVYGPFQSADACLSRFIYRAMLNETLSIYGLGETIRAWCHINDFINAMDNIIFGVEGRKKTSNFNIYNIGNPKAAISTRELASLVINTIGASCCIVREFSRKVDVGVRVPNIYKFSNEFNWNPSYGLVRGIKNTVERIKEALDSESNITHYLLNVLHLGNK